MKKELNKFYSEDNINYFFIKNLNLFTEFKKIIPNFYTTTISSALLWKYNTILRFCHNKVKQAKKLENRIRELKSRIEYKNLECKVIKTFYNKPIKKDTAKLNKFLNEKFDDTSNLSVRTSNCLKRNKIITNKQLFDTPISQILSFPNMTKRSVQEIVAYKEESLAHFR